MPTRAAVGRSEEPSARGAGRAAASAALSRLGADEADLFLVFTTADHAPGELLAGVRERSGRAEVVGCSGEGIITDHGSEERGHRVAVMAVRSTSLRFEARLSGSYAEDPEGCARELAENWRDAEDLVGLMVCTDGLSGDCTRFLDTLLGGLPEGAVVLGGASADAFLFERTYQLAGADFASGAVAALAIRGRGRLEVGVSHGCLPIGLERVITRVDGGWVHELDGRPAWQEFREYLDGEPEDLNGEGIAHLCVGIPVEDPTARKLDPFVIRAPLQLDRATGALLFPGGGFERGQRIRLTRRDPRRIQESARACADQLLQGSGGARPALVLQFDCAGRGNLLFGSRCSEAIVDPLRQALGQDTPWIGFHTYGEIAPVAGRSLYHNYSVALGALHDEDS